MPREIYLLTPVPVTLPALVTAGAAVDDQLAIRALFDGAAVQLVDGEGTAVLTIDNSRLLAAGADAIRVVPSVDVPGGEVWWTEGTSPWGRHGAAGVEVARRLALLLEGSVRIEEGT